MPKQSIINVLHWSARSTSIVLFLFWGAFFVEHLPWFFNPTARPPAWVWTLQALHMLLLIGFIISLKWKLAGSLLVVVCALIFTSQAAGKGFLPLFSISIIPAALNLVCWWIERNLNTAVSISGAK